MTLTALGRAAAHPLSGGTGLPTRRRDRIRAVVLAGAVLVAVLACSGRLTATLFDQTSSTKWLITVGAPVAVIALMLTRRPVTYLATASVAAIPFASLHFTFGSTKLQVAPSILVLSVVIAFVASTRRDDDPLSPGSSGRRPWLLSSALLIALVLLPAAAGGTDPAAWLTQLATLAALAFVVGRACTLDRYAPMFMMVALVATATVQALLAISEFRSGHPFSPYGGGVASYGSSYFFGYEGEFRPAGAFSDPNSLANVLAIAVPFAMAGAAHARGLYLRLSFAVGGLIIVSGLVLTFSRMSWLAAAAGVVMVLVLSPASTRARQLLGIVIGAVVVSSTVISLAGTELVSRFQSILHPTAAGVTTADGDKTRQQLWHVALHIFYNHPVFGVGFGNLNQLLSSHVADSSIFTHAHDTYLQYLAEAGVLGGLAIVTLLVSAAHDIRARLARSARRDFMAVACGGAVVALMICWLTDYTVRYTPVLLWMALPFIVLVVTRRANHLRDMVGETA